MNSKQDYTQKTQDYYNQRFGTANTQHLSYEEQVRWEAIESQVKQYFSKYGNKNLSILDFGCGDGRFSALLSKYGRVYGLDFAEKAIAKAKSNYPHIRFSQGDASDPAITEKFDQEFDLLISTEVIEHLLEQKNYLQNIEKLLRPGGWLILTTPNKRWFDQFFEFGRRRSDQPFENWLDRLTIVKELSLQGFRILNASTIYSDWIFFHKSFGLLRIIGNRFFHKILRVTRLKTGFLKMGNRLGLGIYILIVAEK